MVKHNTTTALFNKLTHWLACWLSCDIEQAPSATSFDFQCIAQEAKPGDVWLIEGRSRVSRVISMLTRSTWSHAALYVGCIDNIKNKALREKINQHYPMSQHEPLLIESLLDKGVIIISANTYQHHRIRVCRPSGLRPQDAWRVIDYAAHYLGYGYNTQQLFDLARFLLPWGILPRRWRSSLFCYRAGTSTKFSCSLLLAEAFASIRFPILPVIKKHKTKGYEFIQRNPKLFTPRDFDISPFFSVIKYPAITFSEKTSYTDIYWNREGVISYDDVNVIQAVKPTMVMDNDSEKKHG